MKKSFYILCGFLIVSLIFVSCGKSYNQIKRLQAMEEGVSSPTTVDELKDVNFSSTDKIGIMAGASTPKESIEEIEMYLN